MGSPSTELAANTVILRCVGEQIQNQALLRDLCLVSRVFNDEFSPLLYRHVRVANGHGLQALGNPDRLRHTRSISFSGQMGGERANETFTGLLPMMENLESFRWNWGPLALATLRSLQTLPKPIKSLHVEYPENMTWGILGLAIAPEPDENDTVSLENRKLYRAQDFTGFVDLEELSIENIFDDIPAWQRTVAAVMKKSPRLRKLSLSIAVDSAARASHRGREQDFANFFDNLCDEYAEMGGAPLPLQVLRCGTAILPWRVESLQKLVDLSALEELHIQNTDIAGDSVYLELYTDMDDGDSGIPFDFFFSQCPKLCGFTAAHVQRDVWEALCGIQPELAQQLAVSFQCQDMSDYELAHLLRKDDNFPNLPMALRMTEIELSREADSELSASEILDALVDGSAETLEGLTVHLPPRTEDETNGGILAALSEALPKLAKLSQLVVLFKGQICMDLARSLAAELSAAAPHLQYVGVNRFAWHVAIAAHHGIGAGSICIQQLDRREREHVELFRRTIFRPDP